MYTIINYIELEKPNFYDNFNSSILYNNKENF